MLCWDGASLLHPVPRHCTTSFLCPRKQETGEVLRSWGDGTFVMPHGLAVDARDGAVWVADAGRHQVKRRLRLFFVRTGGCVSVI